MKLVDVKDVLLCTVWRSLRVCCRAELHFLLILKTRSRIFGFRSSKDSFGVFRRFRETFYLFIYLSFTLAASASLFFSLRLIKTYSIINISLGLQPRTVAPSLIQFKGGRGARVSWCDGTGSCVFSLSSRHQTAATAASADEAALCPPVAFDPLLVHWPPVCVCALMSVPLFTHGVRASDEHAARSQIKRPPALWADGFCKHVFLAPSSDSSTFYYLFRKEELTETTIIIQ